MRSAGRGFRTFGDAEFLEEVVGVGLVRWRCCRGFGGGFFGSCRLSFVAYAFELGEELFVGELFRHYAAYSTKQLYNCWKWGTWGNEVEVECQEHKPGAKLARQAQDGYGTFGLLLTRKSRQNARRQKPKENTGKRGKRVASPVAVLS